MKRRLLLLASLGMLTSFLGHAQEKEKIEGYLQKIKSLNEAPCKLSMGLESVGNKNINQSDISSKWIVKGQNVLVDAMASGDVETLKAELVSLGMTDINVRGKVVSGYIPMDSISKMRSCSSLTRVIPEFKPTRNVGATTSQAVSTLFSDESSKIFDVNGDGIRIGILSDSFNTRRDADVTVSTGDLPGIGNPNGFNKPVVVLSEIDSGVGSDEGRGMAELVHDVAPGAEIYFYSAFNGFFDFADGIRALADAGCDVIVDDIGYFASPYFQDGAIAQAVDDVVSQGVVYLSSAGNSARESYEDDYKEVTIGLDNLYDFGGGDTTQSIELAPGENAYLWFQWDDPSIFADPEGALPDTDLDVFLFNTETLELVDFSDFNNLVDGYPIEIIDYTNETDETVVVELLIVRNTGPAPRRLKYINNGDDFTYAEDFPGNFAGTCYGHSNAAGAIAVGAQAYFFNTEFGGDTANSLNNFSSFGGVPILVDTEGNDIEPQDRQKPDIVGPDGTNTTSFPFQGGDSEGDGFPNFFGTSAAAPHIAAVVALMLQEKSDLTPQEVWDILDETALDMDDPTTEGFDVGYDSATGRGYVQADKALAALQEEPTVYRYEAYDATTDTFIQTLTDNSTIALEAIEGGLINIVALATNGLNEVKSIDFNLTGTQSRNETDSQFPFSLFGDSQNDFRNGEMNTGAYELSASAFDQLNAQGVSGNTYTINLDVAYQAYISSFILVNADTNEDIMPLSETIDLSIFKEYPNVTIRAEVGSRLANTALAEKVIFDLTGAFQRYTEDLTAPYSLFGGDNGNFNGWQPSPIAGEYTIEATPYARANGNGTAGTTTSFNFEIIDDSYASFANNFNESIVSLDSRSQTLSVSSSTEENVTFTVYNAQGASIYNGSTSNKKAATVNLSNYNSGVFIVKSQDGETINSKVFLAK